MSRNCIKPLSKACLHIIILRLALPALGQSVEITLVEAPVCEPEFYLRVHTKEPSLVKIPLISEIMRKRSPGNFQSDYESRLFVVIELL